MKTIGWIIIGALVLLLLFALTQPAHALGGSSLGKPDHVFRFNPNGPNVRDARLADSDGRVPEFHVCGFRALGNYSYYRDENGDVQGVIRINVCAISRLDHRVAEWRETIHHERLHAKGHWLGERGR